MTRMKNVEGKEAEFPDGTPSDDMEEDVSEKKDYKNEKTVEGKEAECPYATPPDDTEEGVSERKDEKNEKN